MTPIPSQPLFRNWFPGQNENSNVFDERSFGGILPLKLLFCTDNSMSCEKDVNHSGRASLKLLFSKRKIFRFFNGDKSGDDPTNELWLRDKLVRARGSAKLGDMEPFKLYPVKFTSIISGAASS